MPVMNAGGAGPLQHGHVNSFACGWQNVERRSGFGQDNQRVFVVYLGEDQHHSCKRVRSGTPPEVGAGDAGSLTRTSKYHHRNTSRSDMCKSFPHPAVVSSVERGWLYRRRFGGVGILCARRAGRQTSRKRFPAFSMPLSLYHKYKTTSSGVFKGFLAYETQGESMPASLDSERKYAALSEVWNSLTAGCMSRLLC